MKNVSTYFLKKKDIIFGLFLLFSWIIFALVFSFSALAQEDGHEQCGALHPTEGEFRQMNEAFELKKKMRAGAGTKDLTVNLGLRIVIIQRTDGTGGLTVAQLNDAVATLNTIYKPTQVQFFVERLDYLKNTRFFLFDNDLSGEEAALVAAAGGNVADMMNVYIADNFKAGGLNGYAYYPPGKSAFMRVGSMTNGTTLSHELGHAFSLPHTFGNSATAYSTKELVNGSNSATEGDRITDTPADPNADMSNCVFRGTRTDANGQLYNPWPKNLMSYYHGCRIGFTEKQMDNINSTAVFNTARTVMRKAPKAPSNLVASVGANAITLNWNDNSPNESVFTIKRTNGTQVVTYTVATNVKTYVDASAVAGVTYTYEVSALNYDKNSASSNAVTATISGTVTLRTPENPANTVAGLDYNYYEGNWSVLPNFTALTAVKTGSIATADLSPRNRDDQFGFSFTGYINVPADGSYTFYTSSDDGSQLLIGSAVVVNNDGLHGAVEASGTIGLKAGKHAVTVKFFEQGGSELLTTSYSGPGISKQAIPASAFFRIPTVTVVTRATVYKHCNYDASGYAVALEEGSYTTAQLQAKGITNNDISSLKVTSGYEIVLYDLDNFGGSSQVFQSDVPCLTATNINDWASSLRIRPATAIVNKAPTVALTGPASNSSYSAPASITISATATDQDGTISKVEILNGTTVLKSFTAAPYSYTWTNVSTGSYTLTVKATDNSGATAVASVSVTVNPINSGSVCNSLSAYVESGGYVAGSKVKNAGNRYECKPWPNSGWCNGAAWAYAPGVGAYWSDAWLLAGSCSESGADISNLTSSSALVTMPNPFKESTTIELHVAQAGEVSVQLFSKTGQLIETVVENYLPAGTHQFTLHASTLSPDLYLLKYNTGEGVLVQKVIKSE